MLPRLGFLSCADFTEVNLSFWATHASDREGFEKLRLLGREHDMIGCPSGEEPDYLTVWCW